MIDETIELEWVRLQHTLEYAKFTDCGQKADAGPVIFVPLIRSGSSAQPLAARLPVQLFDSVVSLQAYLYMREKELDHEFWLGICNALPEVEKTNAVKTALHILCRWLDTANAEFHPKPLPFVKLNAESHWKAKLWCDFANVDKGEAFRVLILNRGEHAKAVGNVYEWMTETLLISQLGAN